MNKLFLAVMLALTGLAGMAAAEDTLQIDGSTTVGPIGDAFAEAFKGMYPDLGITVKKTGSGDGAAALIDGRCDIAMSSRFLKDEEFKKAVAKNVFPVAHVIAMDGVCVILHPSNPVSKLTLAQLKDIYAGKVTNWKQLGGADTPIVPISPRYVQRHLRDLQPYRHGQGQDGRQRRICQRQPPSSYPRQDHRGRDRLCRPGLSR